MEIDFELYNFDHSIKCTDNFLFILADLFDRMVARACAIVENKWSPVICATYEIKTTTFVITASTATLLLLLFFVSKLSDFCNKNPNIRLFSSLPLSTNRTVDFTSMSIVSVCSIIRYIGSIWDFQWFLFLSAQIRHIIDDFYRTTTICILEQKLLFIQFYSLYQLSIGSVDCSFFLSSCTVQLLLLLLFFHWISNLIISSLCDFIVINICVFKLCIPNDSQINRIYFYFIIFGLRIFLFLFLFVIITCDFSIKFYFGCKFL